MYSIDTVCPKKIVSFSKTIILSPMIKDNILETCTVFFRLSVYTYLYYQYKGSENIDE